MIGDGSAEIKHAGIEYYAADRDNKHVVHRVNHFPAYALEMAINNINANMALILIGNNNAYITYPYKAKT
mgnify:CR=1 FL=1